MVQTERLGNISKWLPWPPGWFLTNPTGWVRQLSAQEQISTVKAPGAVEQFWPWKTLEVLLVFFKWPRHLIFIGKKQDDQWFFWVWTLTNWLAKLNGLPRLPRLSSFSSWVFGVKTMFFSHFVRTASNHQEVWQATRAAKDFLSKVQYWWQSRLVGWYPNFRHGATAWEFTEI